MSFSNFMLMLCLWLFSSRVNPLNDDLIHLTLLRLINKNHIFHKFIFLKVAVSNTTIFFIRSFHFSVISLIITQYSLIFSYFLHIFLIFWRVTSLVEIFSYFLVSRQVTFFLQINLNFLTESQEFHWHLRFREFPALIE